MHSFDRPHAATQTNPSRSRAYRLLRASAGSFGGVLANSLKSNRPLRTALLWGAGAWIALQVIFMAWGYRNLEGDFHRAFLPGILFGQTELEQAAGLRPVSKIGYDGQIYWRMSNDLFGQTDAYQHMDAYLYRYQRIGVPMIAGTIAEVLGYDMTPPLLYHTVQFGLTAAGFAALVYWLLTNNLSPAYALGWLVSAGVLFSLYQGLLDAPADAFFMFTFLALLSRRMAWYLPVATMLVLIREGYVVYPFGVFVMTAFRRFDWQDVAGYWQRVTLTTVPALIMFSWTAWLAWHFQASTREHFFGNPTITSAPFVAMAQCLKAFYRGNNWFELRLALSSALTLVLVTVFFFRNLRRMPVALLCALPYLLLATCLGRTVWESHGGHIKACGTITIMGLLLTSVDKSILLRVMLAAQAILGLDTWATTRALQPRLLSPELIHEELGYDFISPEDPDNPVLLDRRSLVQWSEPQMVIQRKYHGMWDWFYREVKPIKVELTNHTDTIWSPGRRAHPIWLICAVYNESGNRKLCEHTVILDQMIEPGETKELTALLELRRPGRRYVMDVYLWQDGAGRFEQLDPNVSNYYEFVVE